MSDDVRKVFAKPGALYRGKPFWAWNDKLDADECRRQIRIFHRMGLGGFFMHSRVGLDTPYLEDEWFDIVDACLDEAKKLDMEAWLYDEDRWPSGAAGGLVTCEDQFRQRALHMVVCDSIDTVFTHTPLAMFSAVVDGNNATDRFIEVTYDAYLKRYPVELGHAMPGMFTDEPHFGTLHLDRGKHASWAGNGWTGPGEFITHDHAWKDDYDIVPVGCLTSPQISIRS